MRKSWLVALSLLALAALAPGRSYAQVSCESNGGAPPFCVELGSDYFQTQPGTMFNFGGTIGTVDFLGLPIGPGNTDTIVQRTADVVIGGSGPLQITALSLVSTAPVAGFGGIPVYIALDPANLANDTGTITIHPTTFDSALNVFFDVCTATSGNGVGCGAGTSITTGMVTLSQNGASWGPTPAPGELIVPGSDLELSVSEQMANQHSGLGPYEEDFFVNPAGLTECGGATPCADEHVVDPAVPEPASLALFGTALVCLVTVRRRKRKSA